MESRVNLFLVCDASGKEPVRKEDYTLNEHGGGSSRRHEIKKRREDYLRRK